MVSAYHNYHLVVGLTVEMKLMYSVCIASDHVAACRVPACMGKHMNSLLCLQFAEFCATSRGCLLIGSQ